MAVRRIQETLRNYDWILFSSAILLAGFGLISIFSTSNGSFENFFKQLLWLLLAVVVVFLVSNADYRIFRIYPFPVFSIYIFLLLVLGSIFFIGSTIRGAQSWIELGPLNLQPVEGMKIVLVVLLAKYFSTRHVEMYRVRHIVVSGLYVAAPVALVIAQPDLGSALVMLGIWLGIMIIAGIRFRHLLVLGLLGGILFGAGWSFFFQDYQKERILAYIAPQNDPLGSAYNSIQAEIAVGSGGLFGKGVEQGTQSQLGFLPEAQTDFIYAAIAEEFGLAGAIILFMLFVLLLWRMIRLAETAPNNFAKLTAVGFAVMILFQLFINVGMVLRILPITGVPLPLVSYGGSSLLSLAVAIGILQSIHKQISLSNT